MCQQLKAVVVTSLVLFAALAAGLAAAAAAGLAASSCAARPARRLFGRRGAVCAFRAVLLLRLPLLGAGSSGWGYAAAESSSSTPNNSDAPDRVTSCSSLERARRAGAVHSPQQRLTLALLLGGRLGQLHWGKHPMRVHHGAQSAPQPLASAW